MGCGGSKKVVDSHSDVGLMKILLSQRNTRISIDSKPLQPQSILILTGSLLWAQRLFLYLSINSDKWNLTIVLQSCYLILTSSLIIYCDIPFAIKILCLKY
jgi:hypothetical protein